MSPNPPRGAARPRPQRMQSDSFRFIDQSSGTITREQRQAIRSAVMIRIRSEEERAGIRRSGSRRPSPPTNQTTSGSQSRHQTSPEEREQFDNMVQELHDFRLPNTPSLLRENPFDLAMRSESHTVQVVGELMDFCFKEYLPKTFPAFGRDDTENEKRQKNILHSKTNRLATFFGILSIVAAHRTIAADADLDLNPLTHDSDDSALMSKFSSMNLMKHHALSSINETINQMITSNHNLDEHVVEAVFLLIGAALSVGNLSEAQLHFRHMESSMQRSADFDHTSVSNSPWIPLYDLAYAAASQQRPLFDLPWDEDTVHYYLRDTMPELPATHELNQMGTGFCALVPNASAELRTIISQGRQIALLCEYGKVTNRLESVEHEQLFRKILQLQYDTTVYLYEDTDFSHRLPPVERIVCLAILAMISMTMIRVNPSSGQGRQMTLNYNDAFHHWFRTSPRSEHERKLMLWAVLLFRQSSGDEEKSDFFDEVLQRTVRSLEVRSWKQTEHILHTFLYMPSVQEDDLEQVLREALEA